MKGDRVKPVKIIKVVYGPNSFNEEEQEKGPGNLTRYLYFYSTDSKEYVRSKIEAAARPGAQLFEIL